MSDTLARSKTFTFETSERLDVIASSGEKRELYFTRKVTVRRPNALFFELQRKGGSALEVAAYYDGRTPHPERKAGGGVGADDRSGHARRSAHIDVTWKPKISVSSDTDLEKIDSLLAYYGRVLAEEQFDTARM
jgi:hypothetical protein